MDKKLVSFCLYGSLNKYLHGIIESVVSYKIYFIDWDIRVYVCSKLKDHKVCSILQGLNCELVFVEQKSTKTESNEMMYHRFQPIFEDNIKYYLTRDADSRASEREYRLGQNFIKSGKTLHSILDQGCHHGLMGAGVSLDLEQLQQKKYAIPHFREYIDPKISKEGMVRRGSDQTWLRIAFASVIYEHDVFVSLNEDIITVNDRKGIKKEEIKLVGNVNIFDCPHEINEHCSNFHGRQINVDNTPNDVKSRNSVYIPITF